MNSVEKVRNQIDEIDHQIIRLLGERALLVKRIGQLKDNKNKIQDTRREKQILRRLKQQALDNGLDPIIIEKVYKELFAYFVSCQKKLHLPG